MADNRHINKEFNLQILFTVLKRNWFWAIIFPFVFVSTAYVYLRYTYNVYESSAVIQIQDQDQGKEILNLSNVNANNGLSSNIELLKSPVLFESAINKLHLSVALFNRGNILNNQIYGDGFQYNNLEILDSSILNKEINLEVQNKKAFVIYQHQNKTQKHPITDDGFISTPEFKLHFENFSDLLSSFQNNESFIILRNASLLASQMISSLAISPINTEAQTIEVKFESYNATLSRDVVNSVVQEFFTFDENKKKQSSENVINFLDNQLDSLSRELRKSRDSIVYFQQRNKLNDPNSAAEGLVQKINSLDDEIYVAGNNITLLKNISIRINSSTTKDELGNILLEIVNENFSSLVSGQITELQKLMEDKDKALIKIQENNPQNAEYDKAIQKKIKSIKESISLVAKKYERDYKDLLNKRGALEGEYLQIPEKKIEFSKLTSTEELYNKYYSMLMDKKAQYAISNAGYQPSSRVLRQATIQAAPVKPQKSLIYFACAFLGFAIGFLIITIRYVLYNEINSSKELEKLLNNRTNVLGELPITKMGSQYSQIRVEKNKNTRLGEAFRSVRSNIQFINPDFRTLSVTSTVPGEGKTFVSLNLATIIALSGKKTVVIDLDLRKPKIHIAFKTTNHRGVSNYLIHQNSVEEIIQKTAYDNLDFISSGTIPPNPSELIMKKEYDELIEELKKIYDVVIIDTPPVGVVTDGIPIMAKTDIPIYVFRANYSKRGFTNKVEEVIHRLNLTSLNIILNGVKDGASSEIYSYKMYNSNKYYIED